LEDLDEAGGKRESAFPKVRAGDVPLDASLQSKREKERERLSEKDISDIAKSRIRRSTRISHASSSISIGGSSWRKLSADTRNYLSVRLIR